MRITDAHQHFWTEEISRTWFTLSEMREILGRDYLPQHLKPLMEEVGVCETVSVQAYTALESSCELLSLADAHEWIAAVVGWADLTDPGLGDVLDRLVEHPKFKGVRHQWESEPDPAWIMRDDVVDGLREVARRGLRFDLLANPQHWEYIPRIARVVDDLPMVIDHIAKPRIRAHEFEDWAAAMARAAEYPQIMCKLSGMITEADWQHWSVADLRPYVAQTVDLFGVERVMFGSDWPVCLLAGSYSEEFYALEECIADLSEDEKSLILGGNARRFYGIW